MGAADVARAASLHNHGSTTFFGSTSAHLSPGNVGSLRGTVIAALLIGLSDGIISVFFSPTLAKMLATGLVAMVLVFRPQGLFGVPAR